MVFLNSFFKLKIIRQGTRLWRLTMGASVSSAGSPSAFKWYQTLMDYYQGLCFHLYMKTYHMCSCYYTGKKLEYFPCHCNSLNLPFSSSFFVLFPLQSSTRFNNFGQVFNKHVSWYLIQMAWLPSRRFVSRLLKEANITVLKQTFVVQLLSSWKPFSIRVIMAGDFVYSLYILEPIIAGSFRNQNASIFESQYRQRKSLS